MPIAQPVNKKGQTLRWGILAGCGRVYVVLRDDGRVERGTDGRDDGDGEREDDGLTGREGKERAEYGYGWR